MIGEQKWQLLSVLCYRDRPTSGRSEGRLRSQMILQIKGQRMPGYDKQFSGTFCLRIGIISRRRRGRLSVPLILILKSSEKDLSRLAFSFNKRDLLYFKGPSALSLPIFPYIFAHANFLY